MTKFMLAAVAALGFANAFAEIVYTDDNPPPRKAFKDRTPEEQAALKKYVADRQYRHTGGNVIRPGANQGKILILDTQARFCDAASVISNIYKMVKLPISIEKGDVSEVSDPAATLQKRKANVVIFIVDDKTSPTLITAPEDHWVKMNIGQLGKGLSGALAEKMFMQRCRKEFIRAFSYGCGAVVSQFPNNVMSVGKVEDLDFVEEFLPIDMQMRFEKYLKEIGVTPLRVTPYVQACKEGWAPEPTNDVQRAVWNRVHELPSKPIAIEKK